MPPGSILIPAVNDDWPSAIQDSMTAGPDRYAGFVPHAPNALPIYEVESVELRGNGNYDVIVKNNGFYPWTIDGNAARWPGLGRSAGV